MRILYDGRVYQFQKAGGIKRYFAEIITGLSRDWTPVLTVQETRHLSFPRQPQLNVKSFPVPHPRPDASRNSSARSDGLPDSGNHFKHH
jgi:hypothetical protein